MDSAAREAGAQLSVLMPNYNHGRYISEALDAILAQSVQPREICVVDDASTDDSRTVITRYAAQHPHIRPVFLQHNRGVLRNLQDWLLAAEDDFLYFAAADDKVMPGLFARSLALLTAFPESGLCSAAARLMDAGGRDLGGFPTPCPLRRDGYIPASYAARLLLRDDTWMMGNTTIYRRKALLDAGGFRPELAALTDGYASRAIALRHGACFIPDELGYWRRDDRGVASNTTADFTKLTSVADMACRLMTGEHAALFPPRYPERWRKRWLYGALARRDTTKDRPPTDWLRRVMDDITPTDRLAFGLLDRLRRHSLIVGYGFIRLRARDLLPAVQRRLGAVLRSVLSREG
jgi:glycosyltransferase involved in cell wall biosynthesis